MKLGPLRVGYNSVWRPCEPAEPWQEAIPVSLRTRITQPLDRIARLSCCELRLLCVVWNSYSELDTQLAVRMRRGDGPTTNATEWHIMWHPEANTNSAEKKKILKYLKEDWYVRNGTSRGAEEMSDEFQHFRDSSTLDWKPRCALTGGIEFYSRQRHCTAFCSPPRSKVQGV
jgi:hypothetical protein